MEARPNEIGTAEITKKNSSPELERRMEGVAVSRGIGVGPAMVFERGADRLDYLSDERPDPSDEIVRFRRAVERSAEELREMIDASPSLSNSHLTDILNIQLLILIQSSFVSNVEDEIISRSISAEAALKDVGLRYISRQGGARDPHLREKRLDIEDVCNRISAALVGRDKTRNSLYQGAIVVAHELTPSEIVEISRHGPAGIITERGGWTSHSSILAREFRIPMVSGLKSIESVVADGETVIVDGQKGSIIIAPSKLSLSIHTVSAVDTFADQPDAAPFDVGLQTADGTPITIRANADTPEIYAAARQAGAKGVGLFRSESLIEKPGRLPSEEDQFRAYCAMAEAVGSPGVRIRTFDIGIDRLSGIGRPTEANPSLGLRSIRLSLHEQTYFRSQVRALLRAASAHTIDIVLPMISGVAEVDEAIAIIGEERRSLLRKGVSCGDPAIGAMIEVPSAIFTVREIAAKVDFLSLGTNDLVQYLLAVDRDNDRVSELYQTLNPAVIRALRAVIDACEAAGKPLIICGEMAGSAFYVPLLIGLGARELSMNANSISHIRRLIAGIALSDAVRLASSLDLAETAENVEITLRSFYRAKWKTLFPPGLLEAKHR